MVSINRIAAAAIVSIVSLSVEEIVGTVIKPLERKGRSPFVSLGGVIEHDIENDLDIGGMHRTDHLFELEHLCTRFLRDRISSMRRKESDRVVSPIVRMRVFRTVRRVDRKLVNRHQLDRRNSQ